MKRPTYKGLLVPYIVDERKEPIDFKNLHPGRVNRCAKERLCGICGKRIIGSPVAFIGPDDGRRCFADAWMHQRCAEQAMQQCPFLQGRAWRSEAARGNELLERYQDNNVLYLAPDCRSHRDEHTRRWHFEALGAVRRLA